ncbi:hypothetical protein K440DRAFT_615404 [Wilcoxina mikolae CBS 423.85]|nr:hypothetical protein K440DRAFT_615404 [Wilcoxina mikolae CBS 423.85]
MSGRPLPSSFDSNTDFYEENRLSKFFRRLKEEPLIPLGVALTCFALFKASRSIRTGNKEHTNRMFRARIYAQAFTIAAMIGGSYYYQEQREKEKEVALQVEEKKAKEKQQAWIRELEMRDREDKVVMERARKLSERRQQVQEAEKRAREEGAREGK